MPAPTDLETPLTDNQFQSLELRFLSKANLTDSERSRFLAERERRKRAADAAREAAHEARKERIRQNQVAGAKGETVAPTWEPLIRSGKITVSILRNGAGPHLCLKDGDDVEIFNGANVVQNLLDLSDSIRGRSKKTRQG